MVLFCGHFETKQKNKRDTTAAATLLSPCAVGVEGASGASCSHSGHQHHHHSHSHQHQHQLHAESVVGVENHNQGGDDFDDEDQRQKRRKREELTSSCGLAASLLTSFALAAAQHTTDGSEDKEEPAAVTKDPQQPPFNNAGKVALLPSSSVSAFTRPPSSSPPPQFGSADTLAPLALEPQEEQEVRSQRPPLIAPQQVLVQQQQQPLPQPKLVPTKKPLVVLSRAKDGAPGTPSPQKISPPSTPSSGPKKRGRPKSQPVDGQRQPLPLLQPKTVPKATVIQLPTLVPLMPSPVANDKDARNGASENVPIANTNLSTTMGNRTNNSVLVPIAASGKPHTNSHDQQHQQAQQSFVFPLFAPFGWADPSARIALTAGPAPLLLGTTPTPQPTPAPTVSSAPAPPPAPSPAASPSSYESAGFLLLLQHNIQLQAMNNDLQKQLKKMEEDKTREETLRRSLEEKILQLQQLHCNTLLNNPSSILTANPATNVGGPVSSALSPASPSNPSLPGTTDGSSSTSLPSAKEKRALNKHICKRSQSQR